MTDFHDSDRSDPEAKRAIQEFAEFIRELSTEIEVSKNDDRSWMQALCLYGDTLNLVLAFTAKKFANLGIPKEFFDTLLHSRAAHLQDQLTKG